MSDETRVEPRMTPRNTDTPSEGEALARADELAKHVGRIIYANPRRDDRQDLGFDSLHKLSSATRAYCNARALTKLNPPATEGD